MIQLTAEMITDEQHGSIIDWRSYFASIADSTMVGWCDRALGIAGLPSRPGPREFAIKNARLVVRKAIANILNARTESKS